MSAQCVICREDLEPSSSSPDTAQIAHAECLHIFHLECLRKWAEEAENKCPLCRIPFTRLKISESVDGPITHTVTVPPKQQDVNEFYFEDLVCCRECGQGDREEVLLLCDGCDDAYHADCLGYSGVPNGDWFCPVCEDVKRTILEESSSWRTASGALSSSSSGVTAASASTRANAPTAPRGRRRGRGRSNSNGGRFARGRSAAGRSGANDGATAARRAGPNRRGRGGMAGARSGPSATTQKTLVKPEVVIIVDSDTEMEEKRPTTLCEVIVVDDDDYGNNNNNNNGEEEQGVWVCVPARRTPQSQSNSNNNAAGVTAGRALAGRSSQNGTVSKKQPATVAAPSISSLPSSSTSTILEQKLHEAVHQHLSPYYQQFEISHEQFEDIGRKVNCTLRDTMPGLISGNNGGKLGGIIDDKIRDLVVRECVANAVKNSF